MEGRDLRREPPGGEGGRRRKRLKTLITSLDISELAMELLQVDSDTSGEKMQQHAEQGTPVQTVINHQSKTDAEKPSQIEKRDVPKSKTENKEREIIDVTNDTPPASSQSSAPVKGKDTKTASAKSFILAQRDNPNNSKS